MQPPVLDRIWETFVHNGTAQQTFITDRHIDALQRHVVPAIGHLRTDRVADWF